MGTFGWIIKGCDLCGFVCRGVCLCILFSWVFTEPCGSTKVTKVLGSPYVVTLQSGSIQLFQVQIFGLNLVNLNVCNLNIDFFSFDKMMTDQV